MEWITWMALLSATAGQTVEAPSTAPLATEQPQANGVGDWLAPRSDCPLDGEPRHCLESDHCFPRFIGPISNPILSKDPRSATEARFVFVNNIIDPNHPFHGGNFQVVGLEFRVALTDRLTFLADKDGYAVLHLGDGSHTEGWLNINAGLRYLLIRDVEDQFLLSAGFTYEPRTGESAVFQGQGDGVLSVFTTAGKEFGETTHFLGTFGYQFPFAEKSNSSFFYTSLHLDRQLMGWVYPLIELNWFHYASGGDRGLPPALGEGDGLLNLGTSGVSGNDLVTMAVGLKAAVNRHLDTGAAWEFPLSNRKDLIDNRLTFEIILRY